MTSAGQDATNIFFSLHRYEVLQKPHLARLQIGVVADEKQQIFPRAIGALSEVPYGEPTWLTKGYYSPYYKDVRYSVPFKLIVPDAYLASPSFTNRVQEICGGSLVAGCSCSRRRRKEAFPELL
jgi:hypothetical protein